MEKIVERVVTGAAVICVSLTALVWWFWDDGNSFWTNFTLNVIAEFVGVGLAAGATWFIGINLVEKKLEQAIDSIARLQEGNVIERKAARIAVVFTVQLISPEFLKHARTSVSGAQSSQLCRVCTLDIETADRPPERCKYCGLPGKFWKKDRPA